MSEQRTTILVSVETREALKQISHKGETYDQIIRKLVKFYLENNNRNSEASAAAIVQTL
jgi:hypothetical protein